MTLRRRTGLGLVMVVGLLGHPGCQATGGARGAPVTVEARAGSDLLAEARLVTAAAGEDQGGGLAPAGCAFPLGGPELIPLLILLLPFAIVWEVVSAPFELVAERL